MSETEAERLERIRRTETPAERTQRVLRAQDDWIDTRDERPGWDPARVVADMMINPEVRQSAFGYALTRNPPPLVEARGPAEGPGPLERAYLERERAAVALAEIRSTPAGRPFSRTASLAMGTPPAAGAPDHYGPLNPFG